ncbi:hypothetical protein [Streptomyces sp. NPDC002952]|uniref:hypothetical protein n=1 Tax=Streptomyces sp. NPDC002952 TaxID=3364673 RepID=UPI0036B9B9B8
MPDDSNYRIISRELPGDRRLLACVRTGGPNEKSDEELLDAIQADMDARHLRKVEDPK